MIRHYPALDIAWPDRPDAETIELMMAALDDAGPTAIEEQPTGIRVFFATALNAADAAEIVRQTTSSVTCSILSVPDESWAERSQAALGPVGVGNILIAPPWATVPPNDSSQIVVRIQPSMGFGTGHHASTRLCLHLLQELPLTGRSMLDVGTGSGVLAIAAWRLGATNVLAIDVDEDALTSAGENVEINGAGDAVALRAMDVMDESAGITRPYDVITANLTGATLERITGTIAPWIAAGGHLVASGFQEDEEEAVARGFTSAGLVADGRAAEDGWVALRLRSPQQVRT